MVSDRVVAPATPSGDGLVDDVLSYGGRYYVRLTGPLADENDRVLKHGETFVLVDRHGDIRPIGLAEEGVYHEGTRYLSRLVMRVGDERPLLLGSTARSDNSRLAVDLTNPDLVGPDGVELLGNTVHLARRKCLVDGVAYERVTARNYGGRRVILPLSFGFGADFADLFEVRGTDRTMAGEHLPPRVDREGGEVTLSYRGADGLLRRTRLRFRPAPEDLTADRAEWRIVLEPGAAGELELAIACEPGEERRETLTYAEAGARASASLERAISGLPVITTTHERFDDLLGRSAADLRLMVTQTEYGPFPYAGVPWFNAPFGRDALITGLQTLWLAPELSVGVLRFLAATQADDYDPRSDAQPGKILHEMRRGEMAATGEIPFARYYGSHDAPALFVMLLHATWRRTGDVELVRELWPNVERALHWIATDADPDGDGFAEYGRMTPDGLLHQCWKDSHDSISHADGTLARGPIATVEIQAYVYAAWRGAAEMAGALGLQEAARDCAQRATVLRDRFDEAFWDDELGTYAMALDGDKRPCRVVGSNAGHVLYTGIALPARAARVAATLMDDRSFTGWGIRTLAATERRFNPMSYHNGSVWPHDTAIVGAGLARYGHHEAAATLLASLRDAAEEFDLRRLPELFCGFPRRPGEGPTRYPVACAPQSWAAGSVFMLLQACLGLDVDALHMQVTVGPGQLPPGIDRVRIANLAVGNGSVDLEITNQGSTLGADVIDRRGNLPVVVVN